MITAEPTKYIYTPSSNRFSVILSNRFLRNISQEKEVPQRTHKYRTQLFKKLEVSQCDKLFPTPAHLIICPST